MSVPPQQPPPLPPNAGGQPPPPPNYGAYPQAAAPPPRKRTGLIVTAIIGMFALFITGAGTTAYFFLKDDADPGSPKKSPGGISSDPRAAVAMLEGEGFECFYPYEEEGSRPELRTCYLSEIGEKFFYVGLEYKGGELAYLDATATDDPRDSQPENVRSGADELFGMLLSEIMVDREDSNIDSAAAWARDNVEASSREEMTYGDVEIGVRQGDEYGYRLQAVYNPLDYTTIDPGSLSITPERAVELFETFEGTTCVGDACRGEADPDTFGVTGDLFPVPTDSRALQQIRVDIGAGPLSSGGLSRASEVALEPFLSELMSEADVTETLKWITSHLDENYYEGDFAGIHLSVHAGTLTADDGLTEYDTNRVTLSPATI